MWAILHLGWQQLADVCHEQLGNALPSLVERAHDQMACCASRHGVAVVCQLWRVKACYASRGILPCLAATWVRVAAACWCLVIDDWAMCSVCGCGACPASRACHDHMSYSSPAGHTVGGRGNHFAPHCALPQPLLDAMPALLAAGLWSAS